MANDGDASLRGDGDSYLVDETGINCVKSGKQIHPVRANDGEKYLK